MLFINMGSSNKWIWINNSIIMERVPKPTPSTQLLMLPINLINLIKSSLLQIPMQAQHPHQWINSIVHNTQSQVQPINNSSSSSNNSKWWKISIKPQKVIITWMTLNYSIIIIIKLRLHIQLTHTRTPVISHRSVIKIATLKI